MSHDHEHVDPSEASVRVRRAGAADVEALLQVSASLLQEDAGTHDPGVIEPRLARPARPGQSFEALADNPDRLALLAEDLSAGAVEVVGGLMGSYPDLSPFDTVRIAKLNSLWLHPAHRSTRPRRPGWSRSSTRGRASAARRTPRCRSTPPTPARSGFYERQGFAPHLQILRSQL